MSEAKGAAIARRVARYGRHCVCLACETYLTVKLAAKRSDGTYEWRRLRDVPCPRCGERSLKTTHWVKTNPALAEAAIRERRQVADVFRRAEA